MAAIVMQAIKCCSHKNAFIALGKGAKTVVTVKGERKIQS